MCDSILQNKSLLTVDGSIKLAPAKSVLKYQFGDAIKLKEAKFVRISEAFFAEIARKFL